MVAGNVHTIELEVGGGSTFAELQAARATLAVTLAALEVARLNLKLVEAEKAGSPLVPDLEQRLVQAEAELVARQVEAERR